MQRLWPLQNGEFGSKIKNTQKEVDNHSTKTFGMFCAKKRSKKPQILEKWDDLKNRPSSKKARAHAKATAFAKWSVRVINEKCQKHAKNHSTRRFELFCAKKPLEKTPNIVEMRRSWKSAILTGFSLCKGLCKMVSSGQKLKMPKTCEKPLYNNIWVLLCKKPHDKRPNIAEMRWSWKWAILQRL